MLRMPAPMSLKAFTPSTPWAVTTPRYSVMGGPSIPGVVVVVSISVLSFVFACGVPEPGTATMSPAICSGAAVFRRCPQGRLAAPQGAISVPRAQAAAMRGAAGKPARQHNDLDHQRDTGTCDRD